MEAGIPCRIIGGTAGTESHAWNIAKLNGYWYNLDSTWDSSTSPSGSQNSWFLLSDDIFF